MLAKILKSLNMGAVLKCGNFGEHRKIFKIQFIQPNNSSKFNPLQPKQINNVNQTTWFLFI